MRLVIQKQSFIKIIYLHVTIIKQLQIQLNTLQLYNNNQQFSKFDFQYIKIQIDKKIHTKKENYLQQINKYKTQYLFKINQNHLKIKLFLQVKIQNKKLNSIIHYNKKPQNCKNHMKQINKSKLQLQMIICDIDQRYYTQLLKKQFFDDILLFIERNRNRRQQRFISITLDYLFKNIQCSIYLISLNAYFNLQDINTQVTPLHLATVQANSKIFRELLQQSFNKRFQQKNSLRIRN
ncbi:unnamed protein product [Paramecium sonneborni]|uniref:Uncharacterized protein n=1 Tax=Paramecium sonneborni TaxID=65129 RepID=A0A8S1N6K2_9CILI|nr:unnamed protein product [Paramecium sonneborni]